MKLLDFETLERESDISRYTWRSWVRQGRLPCYRLGRRVMVSEQDYQEFLRKSRVPAREDRPA